MLARHSNKKMFKPVIAALAAAPLFAGAAFAGPYVNVEANASYPDGEYTTATTDVHIGYEGVSGDIAYYGQVGPGFVHSDSADETEPEISGITGEDSSADDIINWGAKLGAKYTF